MPSEDLKTYATSNTDFYELLGITFESSQRDLDRQWRKTALKYHPDKVGNDLVAKEKFHLAQIGYDLLSDPTTKALYDNTRNARLQRKRQSELFEGKRRQMKDDLEARERGVKRARDEEIGEEEALERELRRLAEDGKRRRKEREEALRRDLEQEATAAQINGERVSMSPSSGIANSTTGVSEIDRTVKIRWPISTSDETTSSLIEKDITTLFSTFGKIETVTMLKPKFRLGKKKKHQLAAVCMVQYASIVGAHAAVEDFPKKQGEEWKRFDSVAWAANKEPDFLSSTNGTPSAAASPSTPARGSPNPASFLDRDSGSRPSTPTPAGTTANGNGPRKMPSFSSFSSAAFSTPKGSPFGKGLGANSPSLEEMTMIRLKNAEKKRLAEELARQDERDAAEAEAKEI
ncbi:MAG: hypothetical protein Q9218_004374 [Villophora microphyllina]